MPLLQEITASMIKFYWTEMLHAVSVIHKAGIIHKVRLFSNLKCRTSFFA